MMDIHIHIHDHRASTGFDELIHRILKLQETFMTTQAELATDLQAITEQVAKIGTETTATLQKVTDLEAALAAAGTVTTPEVDAALAALKAQVKTVDDLVADAPTPTA